MFDKIIILAAGRCTFFGTLSDALFFYSDLGFPLPDKTNPSDFFLDISTLDQRTSQLQAASMERIALFSSAWDLKKRSGAFTLSGKYDSSVTLTRSSDGEANLPAKILARVGNNKKYNSSWMTQFAILLERNLKDTFRDAGTIGM